MTEDKYVINCQHVICDWNNSLRFENSNGDLLDEDKSNALAIKVQNFLGSVYQLVKVETSVYDVIMRNKDYDNLVKRLKKSKQWKIRKSKT